MAAQLPPLPSVTVTSRLVTRVLGCNSGPYTLQGTNTYLVGAGASRILVDAGEGAPGYAALLDTIPDMNDISMRKLNITISDVVLTHYHADHSQGLATLRQRYPSMRVWKFNPSYEAEHGPTGASRDEMLNARPLSDEQTLTTEDGSATLHVVATPGHTADHICLFLEDEYHHTFSLFSGDCILGGASAVFADFPNYMKSLKRLLDIASRWEPTGFVDGHLVRIYPGHGAFIDDGAAAIRGYIEHRLQRERSIVAALRAAAPAALSSADIMAHVYEGLAPALIAAAQSNVEHQLAKLVDDGEVELRGALWGLAPHEEISML